MYFVDVTRPGDCSWWVMASEFDDLGGVFIYFPSGNLNLNWINRRFLPYCSIFLITALLLLTNIDFLLGWHFTGYWTGSSPFHRFMSVVQGWAWCWVFPSVKSTGNFTFLRMRFWSQLVHKLGYKTKWIYSIRIPFQRATVHRNKKQT